VFPPAGAAGFGRSRPGSHTQRRQIFTGSELAECFIVQSEQAAGILALGVMDKHLAGRDWYIGERCSIADIALYAYTHVAGEGGFHLADFPNVCQWLKRLSAQPRHSTIDET